MRNLGLGFAGMALLVACADAGDVEGTDVSAEPTPSAESTPTTFTFTAEVLSKQFDWDYSRNKLREGEYCYFSRLDEGAQVVITDGKGEKVALDALPSGVMTAGAKECRWDVETPGVPTGGGIYTLMIADKEMGSFTEAEGASGLTVTLR